MTNQEKRDWLQTNSERLVNTIFKNLEDNFTSIEKDYQHVYNELMTNLSKAIERHIINGEITSPMMLQNVLIRLVNNSVGQLTLLDKTHAEYLEKLINSYYTSTVEYQVQLIKLAREKGILVKGLELNETALMVALQFPYHQYDFVTGLGNGTFKVQDKLNKLIVNKLLNGTSVSQLITQIQEAFNVKQHIAERIARTEVSRILNQASINVYKQAGIEKVQWLDSTEAVKSSTIKKAKVCGDCRTVATTNGGIYPINEIPPLPLHPHCRCTVAPVIE